MISFTAHEWSSLYPWPKENLTDGPWLPPVVAGELAFGTCATYNSTLYRNRLESSPPVFRFQYATEFPNLNVYDWLGAYHNSETPLIFGTYRLLVHVANTAELQFDQSNLMQDYIMAFVEDPFHGLQKAFSWDPHVVSDPNGGSVLRFGADDRAAHAVDGIEIDAVCEGKGEYNPFP